jgi:cold shock protein
MSERVRGRVVWFNTAKGLGFIHPDDWAEGSDLFVHFSQIQSQAKFKVLEENQRVEFAVGQRDGETKPQAEAVVVIV